jgi:N-acetylmuramoyl-L-alanine amidase
LPSARATSIVAFGLVVLVAVVVTARQGTSSRPDLPFTVLAADGRKPLPSSLVGDHTMVALDDLAGIFQLTVREDTLAGGVVVSSKGRSIVLTPGQAVASANGRLVSLPAPVVRDGRRWLVPVEFVGRALSLITEPKLDVRRNSRLIVVGDLRVPRVTVRQEAAGSQMRVVFDVRPRTTYAVTQESTRLLVKFDADALDLTLPAFAPQPLLQSVRPADSAGTVAIDLGPRFGGYRASLVPEENNAGQVVIELAPAAADTPRPTPFPTVPPPEAPSPGAAAPPSQTSSVRTVVLDPGHGGDDVGVKGVGGSNEKDITLSLARRLKSLLEGRLGVRVLLTRDGDQTVGADERASMANNNKADLLVSLHVNASLRKSLSGAQVFYLVSEEQAAEAHTATATRVSLPTAGGGSREIELVPWELAQLRHLGESAALAGIVEEQFRDRVRLNARSIQRAPLRVLAGANMPAVLVEAGFLSNPDEEQQLTSETYQSTIAQALLDAVVRYRDVADRAQPGGDARSPSAPGGPGAAAPVQPATPPRSPQGAIRGSTPRSSPRSPAADRRRR